MQPYSERLEAVSSGLLTSLHHGDSQKRDAVVAVLLNLLAPARGRVRGRVAPGVVVESEEVASLIVGAAVHVSGHLIAVGVNISSGVTNRDTAVAAVADILSDITSDSLDVRSTHRCLLVVDYFVGRVEKKKVLVVRKGIDSGEHTLQVDIIVRGVGVRAVDGVVRRVDVQCQVDARVSQSFHALIVVLGVVNGVYADGVDAQVREFRNVALAGLGVGERVLLSRSSSWKSLSENGPS